MTDADSSQNEARSNRSPILRALTILLELAAVVVLIFLFVRSRRSDSEDRFARTFANTSADVKYVNDQDCRGCHYEIADRYERSEMARSWSIPTAEHRALAREDFPPVVDRKLGFQYRAIERGGQLLQEEFRPESAGNRPHSTIRPVTYVVGSGNHGFSFVNDTNGYLALLPMGWYSAAKKWDLSPGYERHNQRFERKVPIECVACHNAIPDYIDQSRNRYAAPLPNGIDCQRCHGPGELHVQLRHGGGPVPEPGKPDYTIVNPARLPPDRQDDVCLQCHLISDVAVLGNDKEWISFRPGQRLSDSRRDLFLKPEDPAQFGFSSHATRLRLSRCWSEGPGKGTLTCIRCHDAHRSQLEVARAEYNDKCMQCHQDQDCRRPNRGDVAQPDCVQCHMRRGSPANIAHTVFTDHWIRAVPVESRGPDSLTAPERLPLGNLQFVDFANGNRPPSATVYALGIAKYFDIRRAPDRRQAIDALELALKQDKNNPDLQFWYGATLASMKRWKPALDAYRRTAQFQSDVLTLNGLGEAQRELGQIQDAVATLTSCAERYPDFLQTYREIAESYAAVGHLQPAMFALDRSLELYPYQAETAVRRAHLGFLGGESIAAVRDHIDEALQLAPDSPWLYWLEGQCSASEGDISASIRSYETALEIDPRFRAAILSIGPALVQAGRYDEAMQRLKQLRAIAPNDPILPTAQQEIERLRREQRN